MRRWLIPAALTLMLASCASSERMLRLGPPGEAYRPPVRERLSGFLWVEAGYDLALADAVHFLRARGVDSVDPDRLNQWPLFYRDSDYFSLCWPFIDVDRYGFAVRPFVNREGDDWSLLFPLAGWNAARETSWVLPFYYAGETGGGGRERRVLIVPLLLSWGAKDAEADESYWNLLGVLARGTRAGTHEEFRILEYLWHSRRDGDSSGFSLLGRLFQLNREGGRRSGYLCFVPFGEE